MPRVLGMRHFLGLHPLVERIFREMTEGHGGFLQSALKVSAGSRLLETQNPENAWYWPWQNGSLHDDEV